MNDRMPNVEQIIAGMRDETIREIGKDSITPAAQVAWYWTYIGSLDMAQQLELIDDTRRQALYREIEPFKPAYEIGPPQVSKSSVLDNLRQCKAAAGKPQNVTAPLKPDRDPER